eukprot:Rmarinus@m.7859
MNAAGLGSIVALAENDPRQAIQCLEQENFQDSFLEFLEAGTSVVRTNGILLADLYVDASFHTDPDETFSNFSNDGVIQTLRKSLAAGPGENELTSLIKFMRTLFLFSAKKLPHPNAEPDRRETTDLDDVPVHSNEEYESVVRELGSAFADALNLSRGPEALRMVTEIVLSIYHDAPKPRMRLCEQGVGRAALQCLLDSGSAAVQAPPIVRGFVCDVCLDPFALLYMLDGLGQEDWTRLAQAAPTDIVYAVVYAHAVRSARFECFVTDETAAPCLLLLTKAARTKLGLLRPTVMKAVAAAAEQPVPSHPQDDVPGALPSPRKQSSIRADSFASVRKTSGPDAALSNTRMAMKRVTKFSNLWSRSAGGFDKASQHGETWKQHGDVRAKDLLTALASCCTVPSLAEKLVSLQIGEVLYEYLTLGLEALKFAHDPVEHAIKGSADSKSQSLAPESRSQSLQRGSDASYIGFRKGSRKTSDGRTSRFMRGRGVEGTRDLHVDDRLDATCANAAAAALSFLAAIPAVRKWMNDAGLVEFFRNLRDKECGPLISHTARLLWQFGVRQSDSMIEVAGLTNDMETLCLELGLDFSFLPLEREFLPPPAVLKYTDKPKLPVTLQGVTAFATAVRKFGNALNKDRPDNERKFFCGGFSAGAGGRHSGAVENDKGVTPLHLAAKMGHVDGLCLLLASGADPNALKADGGSTPLHAAVAEANPTIVKMLLRCHINLEATDSSGFTPLLVLANTYGEERKTLSVCMRQLLRAGACVNARDPRGRTALMLAASRGHRTLVRTLLEGGADPNLLDVESQSALHYAAGSLREETAVSKDVADEIRRHFCSSGPHSRRSSAVELAERLLDARGGFTSPRRSVLASSTLPPEAAPAGNADPLVLLAAEGAEGAEGATQLQEAALAAAAAAAAAKHEDQGAGVGVVGVAGEA